MFSADAALLKSAQRELDAVDVEVLASSRPRDFLVAVKRGGFDLLVVDGTPERPDRADLVRAVRKLDASVPLLLLLPEDALDFLPTALELGASDVLALPMRPAELAVRALALLAVPPAPAPTAARDEVSGLRVPGRPTTPPPATAVELALLRDLASFHEQCVRRFIELERELLQTRERLNEVSGAAPEASGAARPQQLLLLVHPNPELGELLAEACRALPVTLEQVFTGGGALDRAGQVELDAVLCAAELPDIDGEIVATSLKGEYPYIDAVRLEGYGTPGGRALLLRHDDDEDEVHPAATLEALAALVGHVAARHDRRAADKRLTLAFKEKHSSFMRSYAGLKIRLLRALEGLAPGASAPFRLGSTASGSVGGGSSSAAGGSRGDSTSRRR